MIYKPEGVCAQLLNLDIEDGIVKSVEFIIINALDFVFLKHINNSMCFSLVKESSPFP